MIAATTAAVLEHRGLWSIRGRLSVVERPGKPVGMHRDGQRCDLPLEARPCSICREPRGRSCSCICRACHAAYQRLFRPKHRDLPTQARLRANARSYANCYLRRGKIERRDSCSRCGGPHPQMHHADYSRPLEVEWLCRACHRGEHAKGEGLASGGR